MSMKNSSDTTGNRTATFRLVAQCLNQLQLLIAKEDYFTSCMGFAFREEMWSTQQETEATLVGSAATLCHWVGLLVPPTL
jgi:hypothetical protein